MINSVAGLLLGFGFSIGGFVLSGMQRRRVDTVRTLLLMLSMIESRLRFLNLPVQSMLSGLCDSAALHRLRFLPDCKERFAAGLPFSSAWAAAIQSDADLKATPEAADALLPLGEIIGAVDAESQIRHCAQCRARLTDLLARLEAQSARRGKLFPPLGILLGMMCALMTIQ